MKTRFFSLALLTAVCGFASGANAACTVQGGSFFPYQNDSVSYSATVTGNGVCTRTFTSYKLTFTGVSVVARPSHGSLTPSGVAGFVYRAKPGFKGSDQFVVRACGNHQQGSGCSTLTYNVSVE